MQTSPERYTVHMQSQLISSEMKVGGKAYCLDGILAFRISFSEEGEGILVERRVGHGKIHLYEMSMLAKAEQSF